MLSNFNTTDEFRQYLNNRFSLNLTINDIPYFAFVPRNSNIAQFDLIFYKIGDATSGDEINYYGMTMPSFSVTPYVLVRFNPYNDTIDNSISTAYTSSNTYSSLCSNYYGMRTALIFTETNEQDLHNAIMSVDEHVQDTTNAIQENSEINQETQNFIKDDKEVDDNTINDFTSDINVDTVDSTASNNIFEIFGIIDSKENEQTTEIPIHFTFMNMDISFTIDRYLTWQFLSRSVGWGVGVLISNAIGLIWTYFIFVFIVKNILSLIDKIKAGEIDKINTKNVLVDVL